MGFYKSLLVDAGFLRMVRAMIASDANGRSRIRPIEAFFGRSRHLAAFAAGEPTRLSCVPYRSDHRKMRP